MPTTEKILSEALELHEKGVSLHSIVRTYPEHREDIEALFGTLATLSLEKEKVRVPAAGLERLLAALPEMEPSVAAKKKKAVKSPFTSFFAQIQFSSMKFVLPLAALAILTGGIAMHKGVVTPGAITPSTSAPSSDIAAANQASDQQQVAIDTGASAKTAAPGTAARSEAPQAATMSALAPSGTPTDRMVASFSQEAANEAMIAKGNDADTAAAVSDEKSRETQF